jgi:Putative auto-transporter adhesin, head GIN domain
MKKIIPLLLASFSLVTVYAQKTINDANAEVRPVSKFDVIEVSGGIDLYLSYGEEALAVSASDKGIRDHIKTEVKDGVLKISYDWKKGMKFNLKGSSLKAYVSYTSLLRLFASGGSDVHVDGTIKADRFRLNLSGGSDFTGKVDIKALTIDMSGGSDANVGGGVTDLRIEASGGSDFSGFNLVTENCIIQASGGSDVQITVNKEIYAEASGASDIDWKGKATVKGVRASGSGSVSHRS